MDELDLTYKINIPFAQNGDKDEIPDTSAEGLVNNTDGLGVKYETPIGQGGEYYTREIINGALYKVYAAVKELQDLAVVAGFPVDMTKALNVLELKNGGTGAKTIDDARKNLQTFRQSQFPAGADLNDIEYYKREITINHYNVGLINRPTQAAESGDYITSIQTELKRGWQIFKEIGISENGSFRMFGRLYNNGLWGDWILLRNSNGTAPLPIGFIYFQLRGQATPDQLFGSSGKWQDISSTYAGEFFRAVGGDSASFGSKQNEGLPNITGTFSMKGVETYNVTGAFRVDSRIGLGSSGVGDGTRYSFQASRSNTIYGASSHVTPYNSAVRVWKKIS